MKALLLCCCVHFLAMISPAISAEDTRYFEMRTYFAAPGKLEALHARFRDHTAALFAKHGMTNLGYWVPLENPESKLIYVLAYPTPEAREKAWQEFGADPDWIKARDVSEGDGKLVARVEQLFLNATNFSPAIEPVKGATERVFELRTYVTTPGNLPLLHDRFRNHTLALFTKYGMTNLFYWQLAPVQPKEATLRPENTLVYLLAHASTEAAKTSFKNFQADPDWIAAKAASEVKGGGSLTVPDGVKSVFLKATDYSPTR